MPLLTELEFLREWVFYKYIAPMALGFNLSSHGLLPTAPSVRHIYRTKQKGIFKLRQERHLRFMAKTYTQIFLHVVFAGSSSGHFKDWT
jgi:hypothetical protein